MLSITVNDGYEIDWHVGECQPEIWQPEPGIAPRRFVTEVYADGHELEFIKKNFTSLRWRQDMLGVTWFGSEAQFIAGNL